ncbi:hypothetical protein PCAR4_340122 [Paraburkholderia caribensis]|nr:hypothetical protein PCAR4_340122 [Paraburkholderia caribensis]
MWGINGLQRDFLNSGAVIGLWLARDGSYEAGARAGLLMHAACCLQIHSGNHPA